LKSDGYQILNFRWLPNKWFCPREFLKVSRRVSFSNEKERKIFVWIDCEIKDLRQSIKVLTSWLEDWWDETIMHQTNWGDYLLTFS
jgi:hypothetical protein